MKEADERLKILLEDRKIFVRNYQEEKYENIRSLVEEIISDLHSLSETIEDELDYVDAFKNVIRARVEVILFL